MTYMSEFDKAHYPLALNYMESPSVERLRITVRRLAQELAMYVGERGGGYEVKEYAMVKYENEALKGRIKALEQKLQYYSQEGENLMDRSNLLNEQK